MMVRRPNGKADRAMRAKLREGATDCGVCGEASRVVTVPDPFSRREALTYCKSCATIYPEAA